MSWLLATLGELLIGAAVGAAAVAAVVVIAKVVKGVIDKRKLMQIASQEQIGEIVIKNIDRCSNRVKFTDRFGNKEVDVQGDSIDSDLYVNQHIGG